MSIAKLSVIDRSIAINNGGLPFGSPSDDPHQAFQPTRLEVVDQLASYPEHKIPKDEVRKVQLTNRQVYKTQQVLAIVTDAMEQLEKLLNQIDWVEGREQASDGILSQKVDSLIDVRNQLTQTQQDMDQLQHQFEETTSDWIAHLPQSEADFYTIREVKQAKERQTWISGQIANNSGLAFEVQAEQISNHVLLSLV